MKYIDADKLIAGIKHLQEKFPVATYEALYHLITSLQQEQPEPSCKSCGFYENNCPYIRGRFIPYPKKVCKDYTYSVMQEQPSLPSNLDEAAEEYRDTEVCTDSDYIDDDGDSLYCSFALTKAFKAGAEWMAGKFAD